MQARIKTLVVDDHHVILDELRTALEAEQFAVTVARDAETAWAIVTADPPDAAIVDIAILPAPLARYQSNNIHGLNLARQIKVAYPSTGLIVFSHYEYHLKAFKSMLDLGLTGLAYKLKTSTSADLIKTLHAVCAGHVVIDPDVVDALDDTFSFQQIIAQLDPPERVAILHALTVFHTLTPQERRTAYLLAAAHKTHAIAARMNIGPKTIENYLGRIYEKLGFHSFGPQLKQDVLLAKTCLLHDLQHLHKP